MYFNTKSRKRKRVIMSISSWIMTIVVAIGLAWVFVNYVAQTTYMIGESMKPTLKNGQLVMVHKIRYHFTKPERFDVIVFENKKSSNSHFYIKRIIGMPGETVQISDGEVYINGEKLEGTPFKESIVTAGLAAEPIELGENEYFVMGDNANNSEDSRSANIGNIAEENIIGKVKE